jgi:hypothetical protein
MSPGRLLLALALLTAPAPAEDTPQLRAGIRLVEEGDLESAVPELQRALRVLEQGQAPGPVLARAHLYLAMAYLGLGALDPARDHMRAVWRHDPALVLDAREYAPPVVALHRDARPPAVTARPAGRHVPALIGLGAVASATGVALSVGDGGRNPPPTAAPSEDFGPAALRMFNCDDKCHAYVNDTPVRVVGAGVDSGWVDLAPYLREGPNEIAFELVNFRAGIAYGFEIRAGEKLLFQQVCGDARGTGCENNKRYPNGVVRRYVYTLWLGQERRGR